MTCLGCGRPLKSEQSIRTGYGPICYRKIFQEKRKAMRERSRESYSLADDKNYSVPGQYNLSDFMDI
jgi:hypothetical protein|nr:MAG TPA: GTPase [Caudoviricetes sp.]